MTRKDYVLIAATLKTARQYADRAANPVSFIHGIEAVVSELTINLSVDNPRFDRAKFVKAAGREI